MLYVEMYGRMGNQLFRYAMARYIQLNYYPNENLVLSFNQIDELGKRDETFYNAIDDLKIKSHSIYGKKGKVSFNETNLIQKLILVPYYLGLKRIRISDMNKVYSYEKPWINLLNFIGVYLVRVGVFPFKKSRFRNKIISGTFESPVYLDQIRDVLLDEFTPKYPLLEKNQNLFEKINKTSSICLTIRRGDFESDEKIKSLHSICDKNYFDTSIAIIKNKVKDPVFFVFSDDIEWAKENIYTGVETYFEDGTDPIWEKLRLMSACKHFIISNSTFSWWSQWLSQNKDKIVVSPSRWFNNDYESPLIDRKNWILIKV